MSMNDFTNEIGEDKKQDLTNEMGEDKKPKVRLPLHWHGIEHTPH